jgi:hypothetical protein
MRSNSPCPKGPGQVGVSSWVWLFVKGVNSSGERVLKACCHIANIGLSFSFIGGESVCCKELGIMFCVVVS